MCYQSRQAQQWLADMNPCARCCNNENESERVAGGAEHVFGDKRHRAERASVRGMAFCRFTKEGCADSSLHMDITSRRHETAKG